MKGGFMCLETPTENVLISQDIQPAEHLGLTIFNMLATTTLTYDFVHSIE